MTESFSPSDRHQALRLATAQAHAAVNRWFPDGFVSFGDYHAYLRGLHRVCEDLSPMLDDARVAATALREDLAHYDLDALAPEGVVPDVDDDAARLGARYVLLGSSLGARLLVRHAEALGAAAGRGGSFLHQHAGADTAHAWRALLHELRRPETATQDRRMHAAAIATFAAVDAAFARARGAG